MVLIIIYKLCTDGTNYNIYRKYLSLYPSFFFLKKSHFYANNGAYP